MIMQLTYKFRIYPTKKQEEKLQFTLDKCCFIYNWAVERLNKQEKPNRFEIQKELTQFKKDNPDLQKVYAKALFMEIYKLFANLRALGKLKKKGKRVGRIKFKPRNKFNTFTYQQTGWKLIQNNGKYGILKLSKIGDIKIRLHRFPEGKQKSISITKRAGRWYACIACDVEVCPIKRNKIREIGIDLGIDHFIVDSDGHYFDYPFYLRQAEEKLKKRYKEFSRKQKGSKNREKAREKLVI